MEKRKCRVGICDDKQEDIEQIEDAIHESFVFDALEYSPLWFVRKGNLEGDMFKVLKKYLRMTAFMGVSYRMKEGFGFREIPIRDIMYIEGNGHSLMIKKTDGGWLRKYGSLKSMKEELEGCYFCVSIRTT